MQKTFENLLQAYVGESQARNRYTFYAKIAKKEDFPQIEKIFLETAEQECQHANWFFKMAQILKKKMKENERNEPSIDGVVVPTILSDTLDNLKAAAAGEHHETTVLYPKFAEVAEEEELPRIAKRIRSIANAEAHHEERYQKFIKQLEQNSLYKKEEKVYWVCAECGYIHEGNEPPELCPSCSHPGKYFYLKCEDY
jgi:rubrerythrin